MAGVAGRAHIEVRGIHRVEASDLRAAVEAGLTSHRAVRSVETIAALGRVCVAFDEDAATVDELVAVVDAVERQQGVAAESFPGDRPEHPGDGEPWRQELLALGADAGALALVALGRAARLARLPTELAGLVALAQSQPRVHQALASRIGPGPADLVLAVSGAATQALAQGPLGLVVDGARRLTLASESRARAAAWREREPDLVAGRPPPELHDRPARPAPLPPGPVEDYQRQALRASAGAFAAAGLATRNLRRATAAVVVGTPTAAVSGREGFAAHLSRELASRGTLVLDRDALRRLDRVDTVVLDAPALAAATPGVDRVVPVDGFDAGEAVGLVRALFRPSGPRRVRRRGGARLEPLRHGDAGPDVRRARHQLGDLDALLLLSVDGAPAAVAALGWTVPEETARLVAAARGAGHMVCVAGDEELSRRSGADLHLDGGDRLTASIRMLQRDGCVPLLVSRRSRALAAADVGVGMVADGRPVPWGADLLVSGWSDAALLIGASAVAHEVSRQSAAIALAGSGIGALSLLGGRPAGAGSRALTAVNAAALASLANGTRAAAALARLPQPAVRPAVPWHELAVDDALSRAGSRRDGLAAAEVAGRARPEPARAVGPSPARAVVDELASPLTPVLAGASALAASVGSFGDAALVAGVTAVNAAIGAVQRLQVERAVGLLELASRQRVRVRRDGHVDVVPASELVVGDVVLLDAGSQVPADCRILTAGALEVDESALTGESLPVGKGAAPVIAAVLAERTSMLYAGTSVAAGTAEGLVVAVGEATEAGAAGQGDAAPIGGVEARLRELTRVSIPVSLVGGAGVTLSGLLRGLPLAAAAQTGVGLAVAAVPEGLPALATVAQLAAARRLGRRGALVRNARSVEALGRVEVLCMDKTGTMTEGRIELVLVSDGERAVPVGAAGRAEAAVVAAAVAASPRELPGRPVRHLTDRAVLDAAPAWGVAPGNHERRQDLPFEPQRGYHAAVERREEGSVLCVKGAPEKLLPRCRTWRAAAGECPVTARRRRALEAHVRDLGARGYRVLAVAERPATGRHDLADDRVDGLVLLGFLALADPVRATADAAVGALREAGVRVVMLTGDHPSTAEGIAGQLGVLGAGRVVTGPELERLDDAGLDAMIDGVTVFARMSPADKVRIVDAYRRRGRAVAMAGDGANDAAAIRRADVGVALGENVTSAARSGADLVVPDGRIETLLDAIVEGRTMWSSVREGVALLLGGNLGETAFVLATAVLAGRSPLSPRQLLLVNLLTDTLPALAMALRPPSHATGAALLHEGPEASLGASLERAILVRGVATAAGATAAWAGARLTAQGPRAPTVALVGLVGAQLGQTLVAGGGDPRVVAAALGSAAAMGLVVSTPGVSQLFGCRPLGPTGWAVALGGSALGTAVGALPRRRPGPPAPAATPGGVERPGPGDAVPGPGGPGSAGAG